MSPARPYPVAMIPYANMAPFRELGEPEGCSFLPVVPRLSVAALSEKRVVAAAVPVGGLPFLEGKVDYLGLYGIACRERSMSVLLFSDRPMADMCPGTRIRLTGESASSVRLLRLLLGRALGFDGLPEMVLGLETRDCVDCQAELIIGDEALRKLMDRRGGKGGEHEERFPRVTDLATEWHAMSGLPFVFARWVVLRDAPARARASLEEWLARFREREAELVARSAPGAARDMGIAEQDMLDYFRVIRRSLDRSDQAGQDRFQEEYGRVAEAIESGLLSPLAPREGDGDSDG